jgi:formamidopyrimidine-DNA glycosylase
VPELPDIELYLAALRPRLLGAALTGIRIGNPFLLRSVTPPVGALAGRRVVALRRLGKRLVFAFDGELFAVLHLMVAGRLRWRPPGSKLPGRLGLAAFDFVPTDGAGEVPPLAPTGGSLILTEAGSKRRASLYLVAGEAELRAHDPGGVEPLSASLATFTAALVRENHTLKRALTDPRLFSGIGNAYSDEILHRARLSPFLQSSKLAPAAARRLWTATVEVLTEWRDRLIADLGDGFPREVTAFRPGMAVHGRYGQPCPVCATPVQRLVYAENEANYCPTCQTEGRLLADRALSRLLRDDWPRTVAELEERLPGRFRAG